MQFKLLGLASVLTGFIASALPASAVPFGANTVYKFGSSVFFSGTADASGSIIFPGGKANIKVGVPNSCRIAKISLGSTIAPTTQIKINGAATTVALSTLPVVAAPTCNTTTGVATPAITSPARDSSNNLYIATATTTTTGTAEYTTPYTKSFKYNKCGFYELKSSTSLPITAATTFTLGTTNYSFATIPTATVSGPYCRSSGGVSTPMRPAGATATGW